MKLKTLIGVTACIAALLIGCGKKQLPPTTFSTDSVESYSLPMKSDFSNEYNTALALEFVSSLKQPITFKELFSYDNSNDEYLAAFETLIQALNDNSVDTIKPLLGKSKIKTTNTPEAVLKLYSKVYNHMKSKYKNRFLVKRIKGKNQEAFMWGVRENDGRLRAGGDLFIKQENKIVWQWMVNHKQSVDVLSWALFSKKLSKSRKGPYKYSLILKDSTDSQMLTLKFNGNIYDNINIEKITSSKDRFISFYLKAQKALATSKEKYAEFFTEKSGAKFLEQIKDYPFMLANIRKRDKTKIISFIMDASPFYLVFYKRDKHENGKYFNSFDYLIETKQGLKFTNYGYHDAFDQMLRNNEDTIRNVVFPQKAMLKHNIK